MDMCLQEHLREGVSWHQKHPYYYSGIFHGKDESSSWLQDEAIGNTMKEVLFFFHFIF